jgi:hypothetical protein
MCIINYINSNIQIEKEIIMFAEPILLPIDLNLLKRSLLREEATANVLRSPLNPTEFFVITGVDFLITDNKLHIRVKGNETMWFDANDVQLRVWV